MLLLELVRRAIAQSRVQALGVIEHFHVRHDVGFRDLARFIGLLQIDALGLERLPEAFHRRIVEAISFAAHALAHAVLNQAFSQRFASVLTAAVRVEDRP